MFVVGSNLLLGIYPSESGAPEPIKWLVIQIEGSKAKLLSRNGLVKYGKYYSEDNEQIWKESRMRNLLNSDIYDLLFSDDEKACIVESITVDDERVIKSFYWDGRNREDFVGIVKTPPVMTRDRLSIPAFKDLFEYVIIPQGTKYKDLTWDMSHPKYKGDIFELEQPYDYSEPYDRHIVFPLLNSVFDGIEDFTPVPKYMRHYCIDGHGFENNMSCRWLRLCVWIDMEKYGNLLGEG